jgi:hypothetical protein
VFDRIPRAILNAGMTIAVVVLERRIRKSLRSGAGKTADPDDPGPADDQR